MLTAVSRLSSTSNSMLCPAAVFVMTWSGIPSFRQGEMWDGKKFWVKGLMIYRPFWILSEVIWDERWMQPSNLSFLVLKSNRSFDFSYAQLISISDIWYYSMQKPILWPYNETENLTVLNDIQYYWCLKRANGWLLVFRSFSGWFSIWPFGKLWSFQTAYFPQITQTWPQAKAKEETENEFEWIMEFEKPY